MDLVPLYPLIVILLLLVIYVSFHAGYVKAWVKIAEDRAIDAYTCSTNAVKHSISANQAVSMAEQHATTARLADQGAQTNAKAADSAAAAASNSAFSANVYASNSAISADVSSQKANVATTAADTAWLHADTALSATSTLGVSDPAPQPVVPDTAPASADPTPDNTDVLPPAQSTTLVPGATYVADANGNPVRQVGLLEASGYFRTQAPVDTQGLSGTITNGGQGIGTSGVVPSAMADAANLPV